MAHKKVTLGIEIGGTNTSFGLVDIPGNCFVESRIPTRLNESPESLFERLFKKFNKICQRY